MNKMEFENQLHSIASGLEYPTTPDIAGTVVTRLRPSTRPRFVSRKLAWSLTMMLVLLSSLMLIPTARAAIVEFIQIGIVRIFPRPAESPSGVISTATPNISPPSLVPMLENIAGETDLAKAQELAAYPILLPAYPPELGKPNHVYVQDAEGVMTILVWVEPQQPGQVSMSLHFIPTESWAINKMGPVVLQEIDINGLRGIWAVGPYPLILRNGDVQVTRMIDGHVLIWADDKITYRLETDKCLEEAIKIAESLEPIH